MVNYASGHDIKEAGNLINFRPDKMNEGSPPSQTFEGSFNIVKYTPTNFVLLTSCQFASCIFGRLFLINLSLKFISVNPA